MKSFMLKIAPELGKLELVEIDTKKPSLKHYYDAIGTNIVQIAYPTEKLESKFKGLTLWVDEEGLLKGNKYGFSFESDRKVILLGNGILVKDMGDTSNGFESEIEVEELCREFINDLLIVKLDENVHNKN